MLDIDTNLASACEASLKRATVVTPVVRPPPPSRKGEMMGLNPTKICRVFKGLATANELVGAGSPTLEHQTPTHQAR